MYANYDKYRVVDLRSELKRRNLKVSGNKSELQNSESDLVARLEEDDEGRALKSQVPDVEFQGKGSDDTHANGHDKLANGLPKTDSQFHIWQGRKEAEKAERERLVLWRQPAIVMYYSSLETMHLAVEYSQKLWKFRLQCFAVLCSALMLYLIYCMEGPHQQAIGSAEKTLLWCAYWVWLGVLSSIGLGTGLHTFVLYLGPHIAKVTLAAYECRSLDFPEPPYPSDVVCPSKEGSVAPSLWEIMSKIRLECFCWGAGTALGELPPYFIARTARLSGQDPDNEELDEFEELLHESGDKEHSLGTRLKLGVHRLVQRLGFWGILLCASIPNPLFDLAGITCGHFLIPFVTFFSATLIGKAVFKMHLQMLFVIFAFSEHLVKWLLGIVSGVSTTLSSLMQEALEKQRLKLHSRGTSGDTGGQSLLQKVFEWLVVGMILYFFLSIVNSFAQSYHKRLQHRRKTKAAP